jgi:DNA-binding response OmpR family regulator
MCRNFHYTTNSQGRMQPTTTASTDPPLKLFIAENNPAMLELLPAALQSSIPGIEMDVFWSMDVAVQHLEHTHYDIMVANVGMARTRNFLLLQQHRSLHPLRPFLVTARADEHEIARQALDTGASDVIVAPLVPPEAVSAVQAAYKFYELRMTIALRQKKLEFLLDKQALQGANWWPLTFLHKTTTTLEEKFYSRKSTLKAYEQTINALERSLAIQTKQATHLESEIKHKAVKRLDILLNMAQHGQ